MFDNPGFQQISVSPSATYHVKGIAQKRDDSKQRPFQKHLHERSTQKREAKETSQDEVELLETLEEPKESLLADDSKEGSDDPGNEAGEKANAVDIVV